MRLIGLAVVLALSLTLAPLAAEAQGSGRTPRIGLLFTGSPPLRSVEAFRAGLRDLGYVEGRSIILEYRLAPEGRTDQLPDLAADLVRVGIDVIVAQATAHALAARRATSSIPIVFGAVSDPLGSGLVASLARPGANLTGLSLQAPDVARKLMELLKEALPNASRVAALGDPSGSVHSRSEVEAAAKLLRIDLQLLDVREPRDLDSAFQAAKLARVEAVITIPSAFFATHRVRVADLALKSRLPAVSIETGFAEAGGLMSYGPNIPDSHRRAATYVDKIIKGAKPADLPVEQPTKFELVINMKTAKALGLTIPQSILLRADQVIQ
jgi:putative ABC transport system substrate-binding protein